MLSLERCKGAQIFQILTTLAKIVFTSKTGFCTTENEPFKPRQHLPTRVLRDPIGIRKKESTGSPGAARVDAEGVGDVEGARPDAADARRAAGQHLRGARARRAAQLFRGRDLKRKTLCWDVHCVGLCPLGPARTGFVAMKLSFTDRSRAPRPCIPAEIL